MAQYTPEQLAELAKRLQEIERLSSKFNENINTINLQNLEDNAGAINTLFEALVKKEQELGIETEYLISSFQELTNKIKTSTVGIQESTKGLKSLSSIAEQLNSYQRGYNELSAKDLEALQKKTKIETDRLYRSRDILRSEEEELKNQLSQLRAQGASVDEITREQKKLDRVIDQHEKINNLLSINDIALADLNTQLEKELSTQKDIERQLGVTGSVLKGISKIPLIGDLVDTKAALEEATDAIKNGAGAFGGMTTALKSVGKGILTSLKDPLSITLFLITQVVDAFTSLDKGIGEFAKGMNLSYQDAANLDKEFNRIANSSGDIAVTTKGIRDTMLAMGQVMGSNAILNEKDALTFTKLREKAGLANEELAEMEKLTLATGGNLEDNVSNMLFAAKTTALNNGVLLNEKQIMKEVAKASAATKLSLAGNPEALAKAAAQAKALGMSLEQVDKIASSLLEIESSISNELEAELLTGKNLNLEQARLYAINNDMEGLSREIAKNFGSAADFSQMNRIQQEAAAKAVGMTREELAATLTDQEALKGLSGEQAKNAKAALDAARARGMSEEEIKKQGIDGLMAQQSMQERFNNSVEKLKEIFVSLLEPLIPVFDIFAAILKPVGALAGILGTIVKYSIMPITEGFQYIYDSVSGLIGLFTGANKQLSVMQTIVGTIAGVYLAIKGYALATQVIEGVTLGIKGSQNLANQKALFTESRGLVKVVGKAIFNAISAFSQIPFGIGVPLGIAAGVGIAALAAKYLTGNDVISPGYGKRTLFGPEGAIALNDKDTVIAGTNLFDKKADDMVSEPEKITEFKPEGSIKTAPSPSASPSIDYTALASAIVSALSTAPMNVNVKGEVDGKTLINFIENNATAVGTAQAKGTSRIQ
jgi:hypothetical protein